MIIGLSGYAQSGKDSIGAILVKNYGFTRYAFADALREMAYQLNPIVVTSIDENIPLGVDTNLYVKNTRLQDVVNNNGWEDAKKLPEIRRLLQVLGTEAGRKILGENIWVDTVLNKVKDKNVVITDCRFPNEAKALKNSGGFVVRVERPGMAAINNHLSETSLDGWPFDLIVFNGGTLESLHSLVKNLYIGLKNID